MPELGAIERIDNLRALRRFGDAEHLIRTALATEPQDALLLWRLSAVLLGTERVAEGLHAAKAAVAADSQDPDAHRLHALLLTASNRHQEATHAGYAAVTLAPQHAHTVTVYAHVLRCAGRSADAAAVARRAVERLKEARPKSIKFVCLLTCPEGLAAMAEAHPDVPIYTAAVDRELDEHGYIRPGLGDAGDRMFGTK